MSSPAVGEAPPCSLPVAVVETERRPSSCSKQEAELSPAAAHAGPMPVSNATDLPRHCLAVVPPAPGYWIHGSCSAEVLYGPGIVQLHNEMRSFYKEILPRPAEQLMRQVVVQDVTTIVRQRWPRAKVEVFGSVKTGLYLPTSDIDLMVDGKWHAPPLYALRDQLEKTGVCQDIKVIPSAIVPIIKLVHKASRVKVDIGFNLKNVHDSAKLIQNYTNTFPVLPCLVMVLKQFLAQQDLNEVYSGGLSSYSLCLMLISFLQTHPRSEGRSATTNCGALLIEFLYRYGYNFNYYTTTISVMEGGYRPRTNAVLHQETVSIQDPFVPNNDVARGSYNFARVKLAFALAFQALYIHLCVPLYWRDRCLLSTILRPAPTDALDRRRRKSSSCAKAAPPSEPRTPGRVPQSESSVSNKCSPTRVSGVSACEIHKTSTMPDMSRLTLATTSEDSARSAVREELVSQASTSSCAQNAEPFSTQSGARSPDLRTAESVVRHAETLSAESVMCHAEPLTVESVVRRAEPLSVESVVRRAELNARAVALSEECHPSIAYRTRNIPFLSPPALQTSPVSLSPESLSRGGADLVSSPSERPCAAVDQCLSVPRSLYFPVLLRDAPHSSLVRPPLGPSSIQPPLTLSGALLPAPINGCMPALFGQQSTTIECIGRSCSRLQVPSCPTTWAAPFSSSGVSEAGPSACLLFPALVKSVDSEALITRSARGALESATAPCTPPLADLSNVSNLTRAGRVTVSDRKCAAEQSPVIRPAIEKSQGCPPFCSSALVSCSPSPSWPGGCLHGDVGSVQCSNADVTTQHPAACRSPVLSSPGRQSNHRTAACNQGAILKHGNQLTLRSAGVEQRSGWHSYRSGYCSSLPPIGMGDAAGTRVPSLS